LSLPTLALQLFPECPLKSDDLRAVTVQQVIKRFICRQYKLPTGSRSLQIRRDSDKITMTNNHSYYGTFKALLKHKELHPVVNISDQTLTTLASYMLI